MKKKYSFMPLWVATQSPGDAYYRCYNFAKEMGGETFPEQSIIRNVLPNWEEVMQKNTEIMYEMEKFFSRCNLAIFQRVNSGRGLAMIMALKDKFNKKILTEIDDNALLVDESNPGSVHLYPGSDSEHWFKAQLKISDGIIVSTENLKEVYSQFNDKVFVVPNGIDLKVWDKLKRPKKDKKIRIGWQGGLMHNDDLGLLMPVVPKILKKYKNVEFHFFGFLPIFLRQNRVYEHKIVPTMEYPKKLISLNLDIMVAPLLDTSFNRGKSNLRVLEAGASRSAVVATGNPKLPYSIISKGREGLLADSTEEWVKWISYLVENEDARKFVSDNLYNKVKRDFNIKTISQDYLKILKSI